MAPAQISTRSIPRAFQRHRFPICSVSPRRHADCDRHFRILNRAFGFAKAIDERTVEQASSRSPASRYDAAGAPTDDDAEHLTALLIVLLETSCQSSDKPGYPRQRLHIELGFKAIERMPTLDDIDHFRDKIRRSPAIDLFELALGFEGETRPERKHIAPYRPPRLRARSPGALTRFAASDYCRESAGCEKAGRKPQSTLRNLGALQNDLGVAALTHDPHVVARAEFLGSEGGCTDRGIADCLRIQ